MLPPYMVLGSIYDLQRQHQKANEQYEQALKINPNFVVAANNLAWNYVDYGGNIDVALATITWGWPTSKTATRLWPSRP